MKKTTWLVLVVAMAAASALASSTPMIVSSQVRANDPTVLDVVYRVTSDKPTVNVRALAFEDGERSFFKVVRLFETVGIYFKAFGNRGVEHNVRAGDTV